VDTGQIVKKGQPLMRMDPTDYTHALTTQTGNVEAAQARWTQADADERRYRGLVETGAVSRSTYDQVKAAADSAKALLDAAEAQQRVARDQQDYSVLVADSDGTVVETLVEPGQVVAAGQVVVRLAHAGPREAVVNLPETVRPRVGASAQAFLYGDETQVTARLRQLSDAADPRTRTFEARYVMTGAGAEAPLGATVTIGITGEQKEPVLAVPLGAVDDEGNGFGVWVLDKATSTVSFKQIHVRALGAELAEISGDLPAGTTIVAVGGHYLHQGDHVRIADNRAAMQ
jgi:RND family efflux transporter MFP subunit